MGCKLSRSSSVDEEDSRCGAEGKHSHTKGKQQDVCSSGNGPKDAGAELTALDQNGEKQTKQKAKKKKNPPDTPNDEEAGAGASNGSLPNEDTSPLSTDKLHRNFQERLITTQLSKNGQKLTDSQMEFFKMLDEKIACGRDYDSEADT